MPTLEDQLVQNLLDCALLTDAELREFVDGLPESKRTAQGEAFLQLLVTAGKLTDYQAAAVGRGAARELCIDHYVVLDRLGAGGMGTVFKALHRRMKRVVAIKVLTQSAGKDPTFAARFQREVEAIARLNHPNIVIAYDAAEAEVGPYLVMEFVPGSDLASLIQKQGPMPIREAVDCVMQAARALEYAHGQGIIHRDIKPGNMLRDAKGRVKLADLGLARFNDVITTLSSSDGAITHTGSITGTVDFMSPEQARNTKLADHRADIYSLGCTLYFLLTGQRPFHGETVMEKLLAHAGQPVPSLRSLRPDVPEPLDQIYQKMLAKRVEDRQQSATELMDVLAACELPAESSVELVLGASLDAGPVMAPTTDNPAPSMTVADLAVVLVEPSRVQSRLITSLLGDIGVRRVQAVGEAAQAIDAMRGARPDLVICTMHLPEMTALDLLAKMRGELKLDRVPFILVSSETDYPDLSKVRDDLGVAVLPKPFDAHLLKWAIRVATDAQRSSTSMLPAVNIASLKVLLVDDSVVARRMLSKVLSDLGIKSIVEAADGAEARELLEKSSFDFVVTDYAMPRMDGQELLRFIRESDTHRSLPVLMVTSVADENRLAAVHRLGISAICNKELKPETLRETIARVLAMELPRSDE